MSRYRGPKLRIIRRLGDLPGLTTKRSKKGVRGRRFIPIPCNGGQGRPQAHHVRPARNGAT